MKICCISYSDDNLILGQLQKLYQKYSKNEFRLITFKYSGVPEYSDIYFEGIQNLNPESQLPRAVEEIKKIIKSSDLIIVTYGLLGEFYNKDYKKIDGEHMVFQPGDFLIWLLTVDKPKVGIIYPSNSLFENIEWYKKAFSAHSNSFITWDQNIREAFKDSIDIAWVMPPFVDKLFMASKIFKDKDFPKWGEKTKSNPVYSCMSNRKDITKLSSIFDIDKISNKKYLECLKEKMPYKYCVHGDNVNISFGFFEDLMLGITPIILDNEENRNRIKNIYHAGELPVVFVDENGDRNTYRNIDLQQDIALYLKKYLNENSRFHMINGFFKLATGKEDE